MIKYRIQEIIRLKETHEVKVRIEKPDKERSKEREPSPEPKKIFRDKGTYVNNIEKHTEVEYCTKTVTILFAFSKPYLDPYTI